MNYATAFSNTAPKTRFMVADMGAPIIALDAAISRFKDVFISCDGTVSYTPSTTVLAWTNDIIINYVDDSGDLIQNIIDFSAPDVSIDITTGYYVYVTLGVADAVVSPAEALINVDAANTSTPALRLVLGYTDAQDVFYPSPVFASVFALNRSVYERHVQIPAIIVGNPANSPAPIKFFTAGGLQFSSATVNTTYCTWEIPSDWDGTDIIFEVDWFPDSAGMTGTDALKWDLNYRAVAEGEAINNGTVAAVTVTDTGDYAQYITEHTQLTLTFGHAQQPLAAQDHLFFEIERDVAVSNDFAGTVTVPAFEIIYQSKGLPTN